MTGTFQATGRIGRDFLGAGCESLSGLSETAQIISWEISEAVEIQAACAGRGYETIIADGARMVRLNADLARNASRPFEAVIARSS